MSIEINLETERLVREEIRTISLRRRADRLRRPRLAREAYFSSRARNASQRWRSDAQN